MHPTGPYEAGRVIKRCTPSSAREEKHFYGCITALDEQVGRLRKELRDLGVANNTMLWYTSDNGPEGKVHYQDTYRGSTNGLRGRKRSLFEGGIRVPGILEWPARVEAARATDIPCSTSDYFPTVLAALGFEVKGRPEPIDGINLMPLIEGMMKERPQPIAFQTPDGGEQGKSERLGSPDHALVGNRYKFLSYLDDARSSEDMLFDVVIDRGETGQPCCSTARTGTVDERNAQDLGCVVRAQ